MPPKGIRVGYIRVGYSKASVLRRVLPCVVLVFVLILLLVLAVVHYRILDGIDSALPARMIHRYLV
jgi:hypothetical protein